MTIDVGANAKRLTAVLLAVALAAALAVVIGSGVVGPSKSALAQPGNPLTISKAVFPSPRTAIPVGTKMDFVITEINNSNLPYPNVIVTDQLPAGLTNVSATPSQGRCDVFAAQREVVCRVGSIPPQGFVPINVVSTATTPGTYTNTAVDMNTNRAPVTFTVVPALLRGTSVSAGSASVRTCPGGTSVRAGSASITTGNGC